MSSDIVSQVASLVNHTLENVTNILVLGRDDTVNPNILIEEDTQSHWIRLNSDSTLIG